MNLTVSFPSGPSGPDAEGKGQPRVFRRETLNAHLRFLLAQVSRETQ